MKKEKFNRYVSVILLGFFNALEGAAVIFMVCSSVVMFIAAAFDHGYVAVLDVLFGIFALVLAFVAMRAMGKRIMHQNGK